METDVSGLTKADREEIKKTAYQLMALRSELLAHGFVPNAAQELCVKWLEIRPAMTVTAASISVLGKLGEI